MANRKIGTFATRIAAMLLLAWLPALSAFGQTLLPQLVPLPPVVPIGQSFYAFVYLHTNHDANGFGNASATLSGNVLSASFDGTCYHGACQASDEGFWPFLLSIPALSTGTYTLRVAGSSEPPPLQFVFTVDGQTPNEPVPQLATIPVHPRAGQAFAADAYFTILSYPGAFGFATDAITVSGNTITAPVHPLFCPFECPPAPSYGVHHVTLPALTAGSYTLQFVDALTPGTLFAQFQVAISGEATIDTAPAPALHPFMLWCLIALLLLPALRVLRTAHRST